MSYLHDVGRQVGRHIDNLLGLAESGQTQYEDAKATAIEQAKVQRDWEEYMADKQFYRSTPGAQMQMYREAGLNPGLMYGQMTDLQTAIPSGAEANAPSPSSGRLDSLLGLGADVAMKVPTIAADVDLKRAQAAEIRSRIPLNAERRHNLSLQSRNIAIEGQILGLDLKKYQDTIQSTIDSINMSNEASKEQSRFTVDELNVKRRYLEDTYSEQLRELREKANEAAAKALEASNRAREAGANADVANENKQLIAKKREQLDKLFEQYDQILERLKKDNSWYTADKIMGYITDLGNCTANIISAVGTLTNFAGSNPSFNTNTTERSRYINENIFPGLED